MKNLWVMLVASVLVIACGSSEEAASNKSKPVNEPQAERKETVFDPLISTMDRAAGVQDMSDERKSQMDDAIAGSE